MYVRSCYKVRQPEIHLYFVPVGVTDVLNKLKIFVIVVLRKPYLDVYSRL